MSEVSQALDIMPTEGKHTSGVYPKRDIAIVRGEGTKVYDDKGNDYIDCVGGQGVVNLGHCHPAISQAVAEQSKTLLSCPEIFYNDKRAEVLQKLSEILPHMDRFFLCNSGAEAVEASLKFARATTGKTQIVATMRGFHGRTMGALSATWKKKYREPFLPLVPDFSHVPYDNIDAMIKVVNENTAAVLIEVIQGEGGVCPASHEYLQKVRELCDEHGALLILDEIQTGFCRTGKWFAFEHYGVEPDLICLGKAIAGGIPMGATGLAAKVNKLEQGIHGSTFGGNPLACAAAIAAIDAYRNENLAERAATLGEHFHSAVKKIESPIIREVRGLGLMLGIELKIKSTPFLQQLAEHKVLALPAGPFVLRFLPPLVISREEINYVVEVLQKLLTNAKRR